MEYHKSPTNPGRYPGAPSQQESIHVLDKACLGPELEWTVTIETQLSEVRAWFY